MSMIKYSRGICIPWNVTRARMAGTAALPPGWRCRLADAGVTTSDTGSFDELPVGTLRFSGAS